MDCSHAKMLLIVCRDRTDLDVDEDAALSSHLRQCADCLSWSEHEQRWASVVSRAMRAVPVPATLKDRLLTRLETRRPIIRHWPTWIGDAAALFLTAGLTWHFWFSPKTNIDAELMELVEHVVSAKIQSSPEAVENWFRDHHGIRLVVPRQFDYDLLYSYELVDFPGRRVPRLVFHARNGAVAEVYILAERHFAQDPDAPQRHSGTRMTVQMLDGVAGFHYLVVFRGDSLEPFLKLRNAV